MAVMSVGQHLCFALVLWEERCITVGRLGERLPLDSGTLVAIAEALGGQRVCVVQTLA